ncbi:MFS transporter [Streptomyces sp. ISL-36]|uniref:MFS transporter n=1 Tax=Streptomyces sp. ISL-36 TaxID=2819182 RepID=UPI001BE8DF6B|nr:MFS transporter [Streptomyces sp. ISL-36]MBT2439476.1 MFS transporter [Streptomyces sp. ISL-36]
MSLGHACVDVYQGAVAALLPFFVAERAYTYAAASGVVLAASLLSSVVQPLFGALTDRRPLPWLLPVSALLGGTGVALSGVGDSYALTLAVVAVSGIGVAAYHPEAARLARQVGRGRHTAMAWFSLGGNIGFAAAPLLVSAVVATGGLRASPLLALPALTGAGLCVAALRAVRTSTPPTVPDRAKELAGETASAPARTGTASAGTAPASAPARTGTASAGTAPASAPARTGTASAGTPPASVPTADASVPTADAPARPSGAAARGAVGADDWVSFAKLSAAVVCRSIVFTGLSAFLSLYARERVGEGQATGTAALFVLYLGGAVGTVAGGRLADRYSRVTVVRRSYALTVLAVAGVVLVPGPLLLLFVALASAGLYVPFSLHVTLGQDYLPRRVGTASGVTLGLTVSIGGLAAPLLGAVADAASLQTALAPLIALPALGWFLLRTLREPDAVG